MTLRHVFGFGNATQSGFTDAKTIPRVGFAYVRVADDQFVIVAGLFSITSRQPRDSLGDFLAANNFASTQCVDR